MMPAGRPAAPAAIAAGCVLQDSATLRPDTHGLTIAPTLSDEGWYNDGGQVKSSASRGESSLVAVLFGEEPPHFNSSLILPLCSRRIAAIRGLAALMAWTSISS